MKCNLIKITVRSFVSLSHISQKFNSMNHVCILKKIFNKSVESVMPSVLINQNELIKVKELSDNQEIIQIKTNKFLDEQQREQTHTINATGKKIILIGIGKAVVLGAIEIQKLFGKRLSTVLLSVPCGTQENFKSLLPEHVFRILEGAKNNLPDQDAMNAAIEIKKVVEGATNNDIIFCLISGGGSALCPLPKSPVTLDEKMQLIKKLANSGADINELNIVRIALSELKGGKLATLGSKASHIVTLLISDIIGDPLELIASGPTIPYIQQSITAKNILEKYNLITSIPSSISQVIEQDEITPKPLPLKNSTVVLMGNNQIALKSAMNEAKNHNLNPVFLSSEVQGNVVETSKAYFNLSLMIRKFQTNQISEDYFKHAVVEIVSTKLNANQEVFLEHLLRAIKYSKQDICIVAGGEISVIVEGNGFGGRNQELALRFTKLCYNEKSCFVDDFVFLSAGTDGVDGMNDPKSYQAAGAIGGLTILSATNTKTTKIDGKVMDEFINNNDSYSFYKNILKYSNSQDSYHVSTGGYTGTNVMDIHFLIIPNLSLS